MKYNYSDESDFENLNLNCETRPWEGGVKSFQSIDYSSTQMDDYIEKWFGNDKFQGSSPFVYSESYKLLNHKEVCKSDKDFTLNPQQKFMGKFISRDTDFQGVLIYHGLGSGKTCTSLIIGEEMKSTYLNNENKLRLKSDSKLLRKIYIVCPSNIKEQYYEELMGKLKESDNVQSCPGSCVMLDDDDTFSRQIYLPDGDGEEQFNRLETLKNELNNLLITIEHTLSQKDKKIFQIRYNSKEKEYQGIIRQFKSKIDTLYFITSHDTFLNSLMTTTKYNNIRTSTPTNLLLVDEFFKSNESLIIIDEIQKMVSEVTDTSGSNYSKLYNTLNFYCRSLSGETRVKVVLLTATPVYDNPHQAAILINLLRPRIPFTQSRQKFSELFISKNNEIKNPILFNYLCSGYISYFKGGNPRGYPIRKNFYKLHKMTDIHLKLYTLAVENEKEKEQYVRQKNNKITMGIRIDNLSSDKIPLQDSFLKSNIAYSSSKYNSGEELYTMISTFGKKLANISKKSGKDSVMEMIKKHSSKFHSIVSLIEKSPGPVFIYSKWVTNGIFGLVTILNSLDWQFIGKDMNVGKKRYAVWSASGLTYLHKLYKMKKFNLSQQKVRDIYIKNMREKFNSPENKDGSICKVLISSVVEGISLKNVTQVHICEPWWNSSKLEQVVARAIRLCSHASLPPKDQYVNVYYHASVGHEVMSTEQYMYIIAERKTRLNIQFENAMRQSAVDSKINKFGNIIRLEELNFQYENRSTPPIKNLYINRTENKYYIVEKKKGNLKLVNIIFKYSTWPPKEYELTGENIENLQDWQIEIYGGHENIYFLENLKQGKEFKQNFMDSFAIAMEQGEDEKSWLYAFQMYTKNELMKHLYNDKKLLSQGTAPLLNCLYNSLRENIPSIKDVKLKKKQIKNLEEFIIKDFDFRKYAMLEAIEKKGKKKPDELRYIKTLNFAKLEEEFKKLKKKNKK